MSDSRKTLTEKDKCIIWAFLRNNLNSSSAAREMFYHPATMDYQLKRILKKTGLDPRKFYDAVTLLAMIGTDPTRKENRHESDD